MPGGEPATMIGPNSSGRVAATVGGVNDAPPTRAALPQKAWQRPHVPNLTGTPGAYHPAGSLYRAEPLKRRDYDAWRPE